jgi:uncharacterized protein (TIGR02246 family)
LDSLPESSGLPLQRDQNQREANAESFLIDSGIREASNCRVAQRSSTEGIDPSCPRRRGKTRTDSLDDKSPYNFGEETMKMRLVVALVGLAISFTEPAFAQQKDTAASQIDEQIVKKFDEAFNNGDAAAVAALYTEDAVQVTPQGPVFGREAIEKLFTGVFQQGHYSDHLNKDDQGSPHMIGTAGDEVWRTGEWSFTVQGKSGDPIKLKGYWSAINVREGDAWKIQMLTFNVAPAPAAPAQTK